MLDYKRDRLDYGEMLISPQGYRLNRAVAATYSADLNTLLSIPVALVYAQTLEGKLDGERFQILEAIQGIAKIVTVYHQKGQLHVPPRYNRLYAFLEDMLVPVYPATAFTSFHPKLWVLRYLPEEGDRPPVYRTLVMSRNLTYDRSWDVAVCLEGTEGADLQTRSHPLADFLHHLTKISPFEDAAAFIRGVRKTKFIAPDDFRRPTFHPVGIPRYFISPIQSSTGDRAVVISPFVDETGIKTVTKNVSGGIHLFSRRQELAKEDAATISSCAECYAISEWIVDGERQIEAEADDEIREQDLHAKVYVFETDGQPQWFVGSANLTKAALTRNTEFMVGLVGKKQRADVDSLLNELLGEDRDLGVFEAFDPVQEAGEDPDAAARNALRRVEHALLNAPAKGCLTPAENRTNFNLNLRVDLRAVRIPKGMRVRVRPLNVTADPLSVDGGEVNELTFENIQETELTRFLVYSLTQNSLERRRFLVRIDIEGLPDSRHDSIFKSIVSSREKFLEYLCFLLAEERRKEDLLDGGNEKSPEKNGKEVWHIEAPIFEQLLVAASRDPRKLRRVDAVIQRLDRDTRDGNSGETIIPAEFQDFWEVFRPLIPGTNQGKK